MFVDVSEDKEKQRHEVLSAIEILYMLRTYGSSLTSK